jgi:hypothetical protein
MQVGIAICPYREKIVNNEVYEMRLHRPSTLTWQLKAKLHRMSLNMVGWISWKPQGLFECAQKL